MFIFNNKKVLLVYYFMLVVCLFLLEVYLNNNNMDFCFKVSYWFKWFVIFDIILKKKKEKIL